MYCKTCGYDSSKKVAIVLEGEKNEGEGVKCILTENGMKALFCIKNHNVVGRKKQEEKS